MRWRFVDPTRAYNVAWIKIKYLLCIFCVSFVYLSCLSCLFHASHVSFMPLMSLSSVSMLGFTVVSKHTWFINMLNAQNLGK